MSDSQKTADVRLPDSGAEPTADEIAALKSHGLWDDAEGPNATQQWSQWAVLDAYRTGYRDGARP